MFLPEARAGMAVAVKVEREGGGAGGREARALSRVLNYMHPRASLVCSPP